MLPLAQSREGTPSSKFTTRQQHVHVIVVCRSCRPWALDRAKLCGKDVRLNEAEIGSGGEGEEEAGSGD